MLKNYLTIALRNLSKQKLYAAINIFGLAVGIAFCALIFLYVRDELTFDSFHQKGDRIYRIYRASYQPDGSIKARTSSLPAPVGPTLKSTYPEVERFVRFAENRHYVRAGENAFEEDILYTDPTLFEVFSFPLRHGDPATALTDLYSVVLTSGSAFKYFGTEDALGKRLSIRREDKFVEYTVTGITEPVPGNSSIQFDVLLPIAHRIAEDWVENCGWNCSWLTTYVELAPDASAEGFQSKMPGFWRTHYPTRTADLRDEGLWSGEGDPQGFGVQPISEQHLNPEIAGGLVQPNPPSYSYILAAVALCVLLIACINFMTLAIGRSARRSKEIGIRKVVGARRGQLMLQFWGEALLLCFLALLLGLALAEIVLPVFNEITGKTLHLGYAGSLGTLAGLIGILLLTGLVAGSYPALVLSGFKPVEALRNRLRLSGSNTFTRALVVVQFGLVVFLVMGTLIMLRQLDYMSAKDVGYDRNHVVVIPTEGMNGAAILRRFQEDVGGRADVLGVSAASSSFNQGYSSYGWTHEGIEWSAYLYEVSDDYLDVLGIQLMAGRDLNPELASDSSKAVVVNEAFVHAHEWIDPIGQEITGFEDNPVVVGVVRDFNFQSLREDVEPAMIRLGSRFERILIRISPEETAEALRAIQITWQEVAPEVPFEYTFLDDDLSRFYENEQRWSRIIGYAAFMAILIACLGLFGLAAITAAARTKEIGIRKVLGASVRSLAVLLSKEFVKLVLIAVLLATPAAYYGANRWLENFAYRIDLGPSVFFIAGALALLIALASVSYQAIKTALADPVKSLRYE